MQYVDTQEGLARIIPIIESAKVIALDTEFLRKNTYFAQLCLIQVGVGEKQYLIDTLAIKDLSALKPCLANSEQLKLLHSSRQDLEIVYQRLGVIVSPVFDTQLAAAFCGADLQIGLTGLVKQRLNVDLPKSQATTDWSKRPLKLRQLEYAASDVVHLEALYQQLDQELEQNGKKAWFESETLELYQKEKYSVQPNEAYLRINASFLKPMAQWVAKALAEWREYKALELNIPRTWVLKDNELMALAEAMPIETDELVSKQLVSHRAAKHNAKEIVDTISNVLNEFNDEPKPIWSRSEPFTPEEKMAVKTLLKNIAERSQKLELAQALLATRKDVERLIAGDQSTRLNSGWRAQELADLVQVD